MKQPIQFMPVAHCKKGGTNRRLENRLKNREVLGDGVNRNTPYDLCLIAKRIADVRLHFVRTYFDPSGQNVAKAFNEAVFNASKIMILRTVFNRRPPCRTPEGSPLVRK